jgi:hypothetical protein
MTVTANTGVLHSRDPESIRAASKKQAKMCPELNKGEQFL